MQPFISLSCKPYFLLPGTILLEKTLNKFNVNNSLSVRKQHWSCVTMGGVNWIKAACLNTQWTAEKNWDTRNTHLIWKFSLDHVSQLWDLLPVNIWILEADWYECSDQWVLNLNTQVVIQSYFWVIYSLRNYSKFHTGPLNQSLRQLEQNR